MNSYQIERNTEIDNMIIKASKNFDYNLIGRYLVKKLYEDDIQRYLQLSRRLKKINEQIDFLETYEQLPETSTLRKRKEIGEEKNLSKNELLTRIISLKLSRDELRNTAIFLKKRVDFWENHQHDFKAHIQKNLSDTKEP